MTTWYLHVYQGQGRVIELPVSKVCHDNQTREIGAVGSAGCRTCVCVYVSLGDKHCFAAHMSATISGQASDMQTWCPNDDQGIKLEEHIRKKLNSDEKLVGFVQSEQYQTSEKKAVMCCPYQVFQGKKASGSHIAAALVHTNDSPKTEYFLYKSGEQQNIPHSTMQRGISDEEALRHGSKTELWPEHYGWESIKQVDAETGTSANRSMSGDWCFTWLDAWRGWGSTVGKTPTDLDCLQ